MWLLTFAAAVAAPLLRPVRPAALARPTPEEQLIQAGLRQWSQRLDTAAANGDAAALPPLFDLQTAGGRSTLRHAWPRRGYVQAWAGARDLSWLEPLITVRKPVIRIAGATASVPAAMRR